MRYILIAILLFAGCTPAQWPCGVSSTDAPEPVMAAPVLAASDSYPLRVRVIPAAVTGMTKAQVEAAIKDGVAIWDDLCAFDVQYVSSSPQLTIQVVSIPQDIVGDYGSGLVRLNQRGAKWSASFMAVATAHEMGHHLIGNSHSNDPKCLMYPTGGSGKTPCPAEVSYVQSRYGKETDKPGPKPDPKPDDDKPSVYVTRAGNASRTRGGVTVIVEWGADKCNVTIGEATFKVTDKPQIVLVESLLKGLQISAEVK